MTGEVLWVDAAPRPGWQNMALDQALLEAAEATGVTWWRLYRWEPYCLSFGRHEPAGRRYDRERIASLGIDCVRRPTGGRAVWHARELTYAVAGPLGGRSLASVYHAVHAILAAALRTLGAAPTPAERRAAPGLGAGPCFAAAVGGEILVAGKKVLGSAQRRTGGAFLQHGSLLLEDDQALVRELHRAPPAPAAAAEAALAQLLGHAVSFDAAAAAIGEALPAASPPRGDAADRLLRAAEGHHALFRSEAWTWQR